MANISIRMDDKLKKDAEELFEDLGLNLTTAVTIFFKQALREQRIPFEIYREISNKETLEAMKEVQNLKSDSCRKTYASFSDLLEEVDKDVQTCSYDQI